MSQHEDPSQHDIPRPSEEGVKLIFIKKEEINNCMDSGGLCGVRGMRPPHFASPNCESNGRRWNVSTQSMVGYAHCSCDTCF